MVKRPQNKGLSRIPRFARISSKFLLGVALIAFFSNYQPALRFPPLQKNMVLADSSQSQTIQAESLPFIPQLPHPGYLTTRYSSFHPGVDIATGLGMPIHPIAKGKVVDSGYNFWGLGLTVTVEHENGYKSLYAHMGKTYVLNGQAVNPEDTLGEVGLTGHTSGPHTHLEIYKDGKSIDPLLLLPKIDEMPKPEYLTPVAGYTAPVSNPQVSTTSSNSQTHLSPQPSSANQTINQTVNTVNETKAQVADKAALSEQIKKSL